MELKTYMPIKEAIVETLNQAFPTIVTSGSMLVAAGFIISNVSTNAVVAAIGLALGRGTLTSIALVLLALPQTLLIGDIIIEKTAFTLKRDINKPLPSAGRIRMSGHIKGYVNGVLDGEFTGVIDGEMGAVVRAKDTVEQIDQYYAIPQQPEEDAGQDDYCQTIADSDKQNTNLSGNSMGDSLSEDGSGNNRAASKAPQTSPPLQTASPDSLLKPETIDEQEEASQQRHHHEKKKSRHGNKFSKKPDKKEANDNETSEK